MYHELMTHPLFILIRNYSHSIVEGGFEEIS